MNIDGSFSWPLYEVTRATVAVGGRIADGKWSRTLHTKPHATFGTSTVTEADLKGQLAIIEQLRVRLPSPWFLAEESGNPFPARGDEELIISVDPIDGSTSFSRFLFEWCTALGVMQKGVPTGGVIYAPELCGGLTIAGEQKAGVFLWEQGQNDAVRVLVAEDTPSRPIVILGGEVLRSNQYNQFVSALPKEFKPRGIAKSCALGLALVAAGRVDALVQSPQMPWDWVGGYALVRAGGGAFQCFHRENERIVPVEKPSIEDYKSDVGRLGFIAGHPEIVPPLFKLLQETHGK